MIQILYANCKATPSTHKLGVLYVVDSIVRVYIEEAKKINQEITSNAPDGTFAAGVNKISELIESIIDNAMELLINKTQQVKIGKLVDIWERAETFSPRTISNIRTKYFKSTTPPGSPKNKPAGVGAPSESNSGNNGSILLALASLAKTGADSAPPTEATPAANNATNILSQLTAMAGNSNPVPNSSAPPQSNINQPNGANPPNEQYIFNMLQQMQNGNGNGNGNAGPPPQQSSVPQRPPQIDYGTGRRGRDDNNAGGMTNYSRRNRSRSPPRFGGPQRERSPRQQFQQPYDQQQQLNQYGNGRGPQFGGAPPPPPGAGGFQAFGVLQPQEMNIQGTDHYRPRNVGFDQTLPQGSFKVLSRTLFMGGVPRSMGERELASVLRPYAEVQSIILNSERKHAFVKVYSRREAEQVITSFNKDNSLPLRTRWGVGFGPRDCCNYQHGVSIIPIQRLTDADRTWVVQAQWGGTGGQPLLSGMVIDEPDIEIGTGISSKAMSKKMPTNSARNGPKSNRPGEPDEDYVKTTLIPQQTASSMSHGTTPDFATMTQSSINPLAGLFASQGGVQAAPGFPGAGQQQPDFQGNGGNGGGNQNPNLSNQMASFFQRQ